MKLLNSEKDTIFGRGLNLEVGSSFWFFNRTDSKQLSYYKGISTKESEFADYCRELWRSGHVDINHAYGNFDMGGFNTKFAEESLNTLEKNNIKITTWINHGNQNNLQNLGLFNHQEGAYPDKQHYHFKLLKEHGTRYIWQGKMTHILGQSSKNTLNVQFKNRIQYLLAKTKYKALSPKPFDLKNRLMSIIKLQDDNLIWDFQRFVNNWGCQNILNVVDLSHQIKPGNIKQLIYNKGFMIVYTHMCENLTDPGQFPEKLMKNLLFLKKLENKKKILITTTSRLLKYHEITNNLNWELVTKPNSVIIQIDPLINTFNQQYQIKEKDLQGLTFYINSKKDIQITLDNRPVEFQVNGKDATGKYSLSIPWKKLEYPI